MPVAGGYRELVGLGALQPLPPQTTLAFQPLALFFKQVLEEEILLSEERGFGMLHRGSEQCVRAGCEVRPLPLASGCHLQAPGSIECQQEPCA